jgi:hypothetical protein
MFSDISNVQNVDNYLPILNGCINAELTIVFLCVYEFFVSLKLRKWYKTFQLTALAFDISAMLLILILTRYIYKYIFSKFHILYFIGIAILLQILYSCFFSFLVNHYWLKNDIFSFQQKYIAEIGFPAFLFYSVFVMTLACLMSSYYSTTSTNSNIINLILSIYFYSFMINEI